MKKLMFGAALAATGMTFAAQPAAQVYDVTLNIKSTAAATATKINNKTNPLAVAAATDPTIDIIYRKQANYTWKGLIWGCDCMAIDGVWEEVVPCATATMLQKTVKGCILWDTKSKKVVYVGDQSAFSYKRTVDLYPDVSDVVTTGKGFGWKFLHCINKDGKQIEGLWEMTQFAPICDPTDASEETFSFVGAGFGTVNPVVLTSAKYDDPATGKSVVDYSWDCSSYIKKISGNFAGYMYKPSLQTKAAASGCVYCGGTTVAGTCATADDIWEWCGSFGGTCGCEVQLFNNVDHTAAYGTWTVAYNSGASKKLATLLDVKKLEKTYVYSITQAYNFKSLPLVEAMINLIEAEVLNETPQNVCDELEDALNDANVALANAQTDLEAAEKAAAEVSTEALIAAEYVARTNVVASQYAQYQSEVAYATQLDSTTNSAWAITYTTTTQTGGYDNGTGLAKFTEAVAYMKAATNTITFATFDYAGTPKTFASNAECETFCETENQKTKNLEQAVVDAEKKLATDQADLKAAEGRIMLKDFLQATAKENVEKAQDDLADAKAAQAKAQKAYDDAECN